MAPEQQHHLSEIAALSPRPGIRLIATDMDGTLLGADRTIHDQFWPLADALFARGITFCAASGRHVHSLTREFGPVADEVTYVASNGAHVVARGETLHADPLDPALARDVVARVRSVPTARTMLSLVSGAVTDSHDERFQTIVRRHVQRLDVVDDLTQYLADDVLSVGILDYADAEQTSVPALRGLHGEVNVMATSPNWVDVVSPTADKGHALRWLQQRLGVGPDATMVFGDFLNDLGMMDAATYSFAMANAHPLLKQRAAWTAPANSANGVVRTIRTVLGLDVPRGT